MKKNLALFLLTLMTLTSCNTPSADQQKITVVSSIYPIEFLVESITREQADLKLLVPAGVEPHDYELTPQDVGEIASSDLLIVNGVLEPWLADVNQNLEGSAVETLDLTKEMNLFTMEEEGQVRKDPHVWLDPVLMSTMVDEILPALIQKDPSHSTIYEANAIELKNKLSALDKSYSEGLNSCEQRNLVTSHAAFAYLADRYQLTQVAVSNLSPDEEPSVQRLKELVDFATTNKVKVIFFESLVSPDLSETLAKEVGASTMVLNPLEGLTKEEKSNGEDYFTIMQSNLINLKTALSCQ